MRRATNNTGYHRLAVRLNRFPQGAPPSAALYDILSMLFSPADADLVARLPVRVFTADKAARAWHMGLTRTRCILDRLCDKALLIDIEQNGQMAYCLPPPMAGFFEFSLMHTRSDIDQKALAERFYRYINLEEDFAAALFARGHTQLGRIFVSEAHIAPLYRLEVLDHERATHAIATAEAIAVARCYCRHKMARVGLACDAPQDICLIFNITAASLIRHGHARRIASVEALEILEKARARHLVQFGENVREKVNFICNCCKCCCEGMNAARRFAMYHPVNTTNFLATIDNRLCKGCGQCSRVCPIDAITVDARPHHQARSELNAELCLGCGLCAQVCPTGAARLTPRPHRVMTPLNTAHRVVLMAIERNTLQHIIFDNQVLHSHRALAVLLGAIFRLPPIKRLLAGRQLRSRYLESLVNRLNWQPKAAESHSNPALGMKGETSCSTSH